MVLRAPVDDRTSLARIRNLPVPTGNGATVPLAQVAQVEMRMEEPILLRYSRMPTLTVVAEDGVKHAFTLAASSRTTRTGSRTASGR